jgi:tRNA-2-methylthio-N6-dimethylallyladenosine synthase
MALAHTRIYGQDSPLPHPPEGRRYTAYVETYGCQMNFADSELVAGLLHQEGYSFTTRPEEADLILINTCAIREHAEEKIWQRLRYLENLKTARPHLMVGVIGCMAERLRQRLFEESPVVDLVMGPDSYRHLPHLIRQVESGTKAIHTLLSREETYADLAPLRLAPNKVSAYLSIMRGCNNMCTFCIVPFTRGRERSRPHQSIIQEAIQLAEAGYKEITLLGQNVDSYNDNGLRFAQLLRLVAEAVPDVWIRFATSHPKDMLDEVLETIAAYPNLSPYIHLPIQSGSNRILARMNRGYTVEWYLERIAAIRRYLPNPVISTDVIVGFCGETEEDFQETLAAMRAAAFDNGYYFMYSERPGTLAARRYQDDIPPEVKKERLEKVIALAQQLSLESNHREIGRVHPVLLEKVSRRASEDLSGRTFHGKAVVVRGIAHTHQPGDRVLARIIDATSATLIAEAIDASAVGVD